MVCGLFEAIVVDMDKMVKLMAIKIKPAPIHTAESAPPLAAHMIPGTDYKFYLVFVDSQFVYLCNFETKEKQILIQGSPNDNKDDP